MTGQRSTEPAEPRQGRIERNTKETRIVLQLNLDGTGASKIDTGMLSTREALIRISASS